MEAEKSEHIFRSKLPDIDLPKNLTLHAYCFQRLSAFQNLPCLVDASTGAVHTYTSVSLAARRTAAALAGRLAVRRGEVVMLVLRNCPEFVFTFLGASIVGAAATGANPASTAGEIAKHAGASGAKVILTTSDQGEKVKAIEGVEVVFVDDPWFVDMLTSGDVYEGSDSEINPDEDVVALPFSSGTTGHPKGVMVTHTALVTSVSQQVDGDNPNLYIHSKDKILCLLPLYHIYALNSVLLASLRVGAELVLVSTRFELNAVLGLVEKHQVTVAPFVPPILRAVAKCELGVGDFDLSSLRMVITGGASLGKDVEEGFKERLPGVILGQGYGMTEAGSVSMCLAFAKKPFPVKLSSCGTIIRNAEMKIVDPQTNLSLPRNKVGEICIRGPQLMKGFLNNAEATKETIDENGWLHSGDMGYVDDDDELFIVDRLKELIKYKGFQVAPAELETLLGLHPEIEDSAVVPMKDEVAGEVPVAFVVRSNGSNISEDDIKTYVSKQVVYYKRINRVIFIDKITKSPVGKIARKELRLKLAAEVAN